MRDILALFVANATDHGSFCRSSLGKIRNERDIMTIGERLKNRRKELGYTHQEVSDNEIARSTFWYG